MGEKLKAPSNSEEKKINKGILSDPDTFEPSDEDFAKAKRAKDVLPTGVYQEIVKRRRGQRGSQKAALKEQVTLRLDPEILAHYRAMGKKWQSRINQDLRRTIKTSGRSSA
jgi:uncharacterized protein (DUF4415 family)